MKHHKWIAASAATGCMTLVLVMGVIGQEQSPADAPTGFDTKTNGMVDQATHDKDRTVLEEVDKASTGLGPVFNGTSCTTCHQNPASGGTSQVTELRAGHLDESHNFQNPVVVIDHGTNTITGRSLIDKFAICANAQETVPETETIRATRMSVNTLGDGFVEAIDDNTLLQIAQTQRLLSGGTIHGDAIQVPVLEASGQTRIGRFGWKDQQGSLLSFAADAYLNEQGITTRLLPDDITSVCNNVPGVQDPTGADGLADIDHFARFIRATKAPPVDRARASQPAAQAGSATFDRIGCNLCHVRSLRTAPAGTPINGGTFTIPVALGDKLIHPFSDFLLHDVGTGDGIVQNGGPSSANKLRTPPLWGVRLRTDLLHDGQSHSYSDAIRRHGGEASRVIDAYRGLTDTQKQQLNAFLNSL